MSKEQISNDLADKIVEVLHTNTVLSNYSACYVKKILKDHNLIEESALEKAERLAIEFDYYLKKISHVRGLKISAFQDICHYYDKAIAELNARIKELEEGKK